MLPKYKRIYDFYEWMGRSESQLWGVLRIFRKVYCIYCDKNKGSDIVYIMLDSKDLTDYFEANNMPKPLEGKNNLKQESKV